MNFLNFIFQLVPLYYLLTIFEKVLIDLSKVKIPEIKISELPHLDEEILKVKKGGSIKNKNNIGRNCQRLISIFTRI
ncbi:hypothetical protein [Methanosarcina barkeri]|uniref:hypothetical protein n=1 Tax=Methanosarcina barkeri TaxID=2208 RepID=UPI0006D18CE8|nr:hypothetical protein [Methanosarcina barkeri]